MFSKADFQRRVALNIDHWQTMADQPPGQNLNQVRRAIDFGLRYRPTRVPAIQLLVDQFVWVEGEGHGESWFELYERALANCPPEELGLRFWLTGRYGRLLFRAHRYAEALQQHEQALSLAHQLKQPDLLAQAHLYLGADYWQQHENELARQQAEQALTYLAQAAAPPDKFADAWQLLGLLGDQLGDLAAGEQAYLQAVAYRRLAQQPHALAHELNNLANLYQKQRRWALAESNYEEALAVLPVAAYPVIAAAIYNSLGTLHFNLDRLEEARDAFRQAARRYERLPGQTTRSALVLTNLGQLSLKLGQLPAALDYLQRAATIWRQYGQLLWLANVLGGLGEYYQRIGDRVQAKSSYEEAIQLLAAFPDNDWACKWTADFTEALAGL